MKQANKITIRTFTPPEEDREENKKTILELTGYTEEEIEKEKIKYEERNAKGFSQKNIIIHTLELEKDRHCNKFLERLASKLTEEDKHTLISQTNRLDDNMNFYIRLNKEKLRKQEYEVTESGECYHIKISIASFPKRKDVAHKKIKEIIKKS